MVWYVHKYEICVKQWISNEAWHHASSLYIGPKYIYIQR